MSIDKQSGGPAPDRLEIKVTGAFGGTEVKDLLRTQNVEMVVRGTVVGHTFSDKYDKNGDRDSTVKIAVVKCDQLTALSIVPAVRQAPGQTAMPMDDGFEEDHGEVVDADVVDELEPGVPEGVDPETGEVLDDASENGAGQPDSEADGDGDGDGKPSAVEEEDPDLEWR